ncbi:CapA family protein [Shewanella sp. KX20019]|uniref:CapA family protein n=1 Tax=Shewanella sp. KX20019 TaxID=2803864 RepID=UPI0019271C17|nr:CapA family protein [Shewanella sp. KX20019]QQX80058.1 CapA family protein [Shewanella sp. KX20019]
MTFKLICCSVFLLSANVATAADLITLKGRVFTEADMPIARAQVSVGQQLVQTDNEGRYELKVAAAESYLLKLQAKGHYQGLQTFSHYELGASHNTIGDIQLVAEKAGRTLLTFGGDVMMGRRYAKPRFNNAVIINAESKTEDTRSIVQHVKPYLSLADLASVNLETQIAAHKPAERAPKSVTFYSPPETLAALEWAGVDFVTLGNNHTYDYLDEGLDSTLAYLAQSPLAYAGAGKDQADALAAHRTTLNGNPFSFLGYVGWQGNFTPNQTASLKKGGAAFGSEDNIQASVAKEASASRATVVQYHGGLEYSAEPTMVLEQKLKLAIDSGADLAVGHHPHVTQGFEIYNDKLIAYSMGNFIFDQYFYATPYSFMLNVWMDGDVFHRAEIVPVYLKGYKPTPATGAQRYTVLKRLSTLSKKRGVDIQVSGGHGVITRHSPSSEPGMLTIKPLAEQSVFDLYNSDWSQQLKHVESNKAGIKYRVGKNLVNGSDFESFALFNTAERGWDLDQSPFEITTAEASSGQYALEARLPAKATATIGMTNFRRVYNSSSPMTLALNIKAPQYTKVNLYWQGRKTREKLDTALQQGEKHLISSQLLSGGNAQWQNIEAQFNSPRIGYRSIRVLVEFENLSQSSESIYVDDINLIEWQSAFSSQPNFKPMSDDAAAASHIGFDRPLAANEQVTLSF